MNFYEELTQKAEKVNEYLKKEVVFPALPQKTVFDAIFYSLFAGGKRIRPVLSLACAEAVGGKAEDALPFGSALEMIHTYSLIHDDLPSMDNDDYRRGRLTNHKVYGEAAAILAGDGLLNYAMEFALSRGKDNKNLIPILENLFEASGIFGMIGGQMIDLESEGKTLSASEMETIHLLKTGALIKAACRIGALAGGGEADAFDTYAEAIGLAFQIKDDILDVIGSSETLGKAVGSDEKNQKSTYVSLYGMSEAEKMLEKETNRAIESVESPFLKEFARYLLEREK